MKEGQSGEGYGIACRKAEISEEVGQGHRLRVRAIEEGWKCLVKGKGEKVSWRHIMKDFAFHHWKYIHYPECDGTLQKILQPWR